jgi:hypothetical protein
MSAASGESTAPPGSVLAAIGVTRHLPPNSEDRFSTT